LCYLCSNTHSVVDTLRKKCGKSFKRISCQRKVNLLQRLFYVLCWFCLYDYYHIKIKASTELFFYFIQIFIPVNDQGVHWYLMVVDVIERKLVLLDSLPCPERNYLRRREVLKLVCILHVCYFITYYSAFVTKVCNLLQGIFIEEMLSNDSVVDDVDSSNSISNFCIIQPRPLPTQRTGS
jgi:hypothetical protein